MEPQEPQEVLKSEADQLFHEFVKTHRFKDRHAFIQYTNSLKLMHVEDKCLECAPRNVDNIRKSGCLVLNPCDEGDRSDIKNTRKSERKSRKSVCVQKLEYSFSESEDDGDDSKQNDDKDEEEDEDNHDTDGCAEEDVDVDGVDLEKEENYGESDDEVFMSKELRKTIGVEFEDEATDEIEVLSDASPIITKKKKQVIRTISSGSDATSSDEESEKSDDRDFIKDTTSESNESSDESIVEKSLNLSSDNATHKAKGETAVPKKVTVIESSSDDEDNYNKFLTKNKQPKQSRMSSIDVSSDDDDFATPLHTKSTNFKTPKTGFHTPHTYKTPKSTFKTPRSSLGNVLHKFPAVEPRTPKYKHHFNKQRDELIKELFTLYNRTVFENKLPSDFQIMWNKRMTKTAGFCYLKTTASGRISHVELSTKVVDTVERLRDTLIHELCHAATWIFEGKRGHGLAWKYWAKKANKIHPELPIIETCHSYEIETKFKYQCEGCGSVFGRHTKSIDATKHACAKCGGRPLLLSVSGSSVSDTPKKPNAYSEYVKKHYSRIKGENPDSSSRDIMKLIGEDFRAFKLSESENKENVSGP